MEYKTAELKGATLNAAVAKAEGVVIVCLTPITNNPTARWCSRADTGEPWNPSTDWAQGGPIIERERDAIVDWLIRTGETLTWLRYAELADWMRAYVGAKFGDAVEL